MISSHLISSEAPVFRSAMSTPTTVLVTIWLTEKDLNKEMLKDWDSVKFP